jgi:hypothetical protein
MVPGDVPNPSFLATKAWPIKYMMNTPTKRSVICGIVKLSRRAIYTCGAKLNRSPHPF